VGCFLPALQPLVREPDKQGSKWLGGFERAANGTNAGAWLEMLARRAPRRPSPSPFGMPRHPADGPLTTPLPRIGLIALDIAFWRAKRLALAVKPKNCGSLNC
jgi:hypothetical protein